MTYFSTMLLHKIKVIARSIKILKLIYHENIQTVAFIDVCKSNISFLFIEYCIYDAIKLLVKFGKFYFWILYLNATLFIAWSKVLPRFYF